MPFNAVAATNDFATAKYKGVQGNNITFVIQANVPYQWLIKHVSSDHCKSKLKMTKSRDAK
ncbi:hypothetical protein C7B90_04175 [Lysinibacillus fusiformis]|nr:hypothetical protein LSP_07125 [Lysinibacillus sphaericus]RDV34724.1 hypothetical protein C7B90_04175 [Lysinibacillus fusiformis]